MRVLKVYIDTSVLGAILDIEDRHRVEISMNFLGMVKDKKIEGFITNISLEEIEKAPQEIRTQIRETVVQIKPYVLNESPDCADLVELYLQEGVVPAKFRDDARHIAVAVVNELDAVISWNYCHMVNIVTKRRVNAVNLRTGYKQIEILSPEELLLNKWNYKSLEWIHKVRERNYERTKDEPLIQVMEESRKAAEKVIEQLNLPVFKRPQLVSIE